MSFVNIGAQLAILLDEITEISQVYDHQPKEVTQFPSAIITAGSFEDTPYDTGANRRTYNFNIRLYYRVDNPDDAERVMWDLVDKVLAKLDGNVTLNNSCDFTNLVNGPFSFEEREVPLLVCNISLRAIRRVTRS